MCGIAGVIDLRENFQAQSNSIVRRLLETLNNRGPDSKGLLDFPGHGLSIGHTRLAIQDLTESGYQPMMSSSQRFSISFNGEIYNHLKLIYYE